MTDYLYTITFIRLEDDEGVRQEITLNDEEKAITAYYTIDNKDDCMNVRLFRKKVK